MTARMFWAIIMLGYFWVVLGNFDKWFWHLLNLWERPQPKPDYEDSLRREGVVVKVKGGETSEK